MSIVVKREDTRRRNVPVTKEKREILYSWVNRDGSGEAFIRCNLIQLAGYLGCSMAEARFHAKKAGCYNNGTTRDVIIQIHEWSPDNTKAYIISVEPPDMVENTKIHSILTDEQREAFLATEFDKLMMHKQRVRNVEDILHYP